MNRKEPASVSVPAGPPSQIFHSPTKIKVSPVIAKASRAIESRLTSRTVFITLLVS